MKKKKSSTSTTSTTKTVSRKRPSPAVTDGDRHDTVTGGCSSSSFYSSNNTINNHFFVIIFFAGSVVAAGIALWFNKGIHNNSKDNTSDSQTTPTYAGTVPYSAATLPDLIDVACSTSSNRDGRSTSSSYVQCNDYLWTTQGRTMMTSPSWHQKIKRGMKLFEVPRQSQIPVTYAIRYFYESHFVDTDMKTVDIYLRHKQSGNGSTAAAAAGGDDHGDNDGYLDPRAYLAWYLAVMTKTQTSSSSTTTAGRHHSGSSSSNNNKLSVQQQQQVSELHRTYLSYLPTLQDFESFHHPILTTTKESSTVPSPSTATATSATLHLPFLEELLAGRWRNEIESEWKVLERIMTVKASSADVHTNTVIERNEYWTARLWVTTRSFTGGIPTNTEVTDVELRRWQHVGILPPDAAVDRLRSKLTSTMVPLQDSFDHSVLPNVGWKADINGDGTNSFTGFAATDFESSYHGGDDRTSVELKITYGISTPESWIYAQYGFVSTIPSEQQVTRKAALLSIHQIHDLFLESQTSQLVHKQESILQDLYLTYQDGYTNCPVEDDHDDERRREFQRLKLKVLQRLYANSYHKWVVTIPAQHQHGQQSVEDNSVHLSPPRADSGLNEIIKTCRLLALTHLDYDGSATEILKKGFSNNQHELSLPSTPSSSSSGTTSFASLSLEYRTWIWIERLARIRLIDVLSGRPPASLSSISTDEMSKMVLQEWNNKLLQSETSSRDHPKLLVQLGELEAASVVARYAYQKHNEIKTMVQDPQTNQEHRGDEMSLMTVRSQPCA